MIPTDEIWIPTDENCADDHPRIAELKRELAELHPTGDWMLRNRTSMS